MNNLNVLHLLATMQELDKRVQTLAKASLKLVQIIDEHEQRLRVLEPPPTEQLTKAQDQGSPV